MYRTNSAHSRHALPSLASLARQVALLPFTWLFGDIFVWLVIKFVERFLFTFPNCLYFTYACKGPLRWVMRFLALTILWAWWVLTSTDVRSLFARPDSLTRATRFARSPVRPFARSPA